MSPDKGTLSRFERRTKMDFNETFENIKTKATEAAQTAATKAKNLAQIAKANIDIRSEQDKQKKAYTELGKLFYRDFITGEEADEAEYMPWCDKVTESVRKVNELREQIDELKAKDAPADVDRCEDAESEPGKVAECLEAVKEKAEAMKADACECAEEVKEKVCECAEEVKEEVCECADEIKPEE